MKTEKELKTLKNFEKMGGNALSLNAVFAEVKDLREEAIKWVQTYRKDCINSLDELAWIEFFNLTEEDLE